MRDELCTAVDEVFLVCVDQSSRLPDIFFRLVAWNLQDLLYEHVCSTAVLF